MGIRSDVFLGFKTELHNQLPESVKTMLLDTQDDVLTDEEGTAYFIEDVKWYRDSDDEIVALYEWLSNNDPDGSHHIVVTACHDYPTNDDGDAGSWHNNPWGIQRCVSVSLEFNRDLT